MSLICKIGDRPKSLALQYGWHQETYLPEITIYQQSQLLMIEFQTEADLKYNTNHQAYNFVEGLWEKDVFEIFIGSPTNSHYQEFNFAPSAALWSATFSDYRKLKESNLSLVSEVKVSSQIKDTLSKISIEIPITLIKDFIDNNQFRCNFTCIIGKEYYSWSNLRSKNPDFHLFQEFNTLELDPSRS